MRFNVAQDSLNSALSKIAFALENKDELEAYTHVAMRCLGNEVRLTASNRFMNTEAKIFSKDSIPDLAFGVRGDLLKKVVKALEPGNIELILDDSNLVMKSNSSYLALPMLRPTEFENIFPNHTDYSTRALEFRELDVPGFMSSLRKVMRCYDEDNPRYSVIAVNDDNFMSTDGFQIAFCKNTFFEMNTCVKIKAEQALRLWRVFNSYKSNGGICIDNSRLHITCEGISCGVKLSNIEVPDYTISLSGDMSHKVTFDKEEVLSLLKRVSSFEDKDSKKGKRKGLRVLIAVAGTKILVKSESTLGKIEESIECSGSVFCKFVINSRQFLNAVSGIDAESVNMFVIYNKHGKIFKIILKEEEYISAVVVSSG